MTKLFNKLLLLIALATIAGCGFTPYNIKSLPPQLHQVYYQTTQNYEQFEVNFKRKLKACGIILLPAPKKNAPIIHTTSNYSYPNSSPTSSTQARIYNLNYSATISISDSANNPLLDTQTAAVSRSISLQPNEVFAMTSQIEIAKQQIIQELIAKIFNILRSTKTRQALEKLTP